MNIWLSLWSIGQDHSLEDLKLIKNAGFTGVEIWGDHETSEQSLAFAKECDLEIGMHLPFRHYNLASVDEDMGSKTLNAMKNCLKKLAEHGGEHAVIHGGSVSKEDNLEKSYENLVNRLKDLNDYAEKYGVELLFENQIPDKDPTSHIYPVSINEWLDILKLTNTKACLDLGHLAVHGESFKRTVDVLGDSMKTFHLSDNDYKADLHLIPGDGELLKDSPLQYLKTVNYQGPIVLEISPYKYSLNDILEHQSIIDFEKIF